MANKLNPELVQNIAELTNVKKISDLPIIDVIEKDNETEKIRTSQQFNNSYLLSSTLLEDNSQVGGRYFNYRVKLNEVTDYLSTLSEENLSTFKQTFDFFVDSLKNNTENSYVQFIPANDTIDTENDVNNYSYTFKYKLSDVLDEVIGFTYNITDGIEEISTYSYTNVLTDGLVTNTTLEKYVRNSIATILGVPNTPAYVSEAIDSVIEFVDWFKGYTKDKDGLNELLTKIDNKDKEIIASYTAADAEINARIDNLDVNATAQEKQFITGFKQTDGKINSVTRRQIEVSDISGLEDTIAGSHGLSGKNISVDKNNYINCYIDIDTTNNNNKLTIGTTDYFLTLSNDGKLSFSKYTPIDLTNITSTKTFEYNSGAQTFMVSAKPTKECTVADKWENDNESSNITYSAKSTISASVTSYYSTSYTLTVKETDSNHATKSATVNVNYTTYSYWCGVSVNDTITSIDTLTRSTTLNTGKPDRIYFNNSMFNGESAYIYFAIKSSVSTFYFTTGTNDTQTPGGIIPVGTITIPRYNNMSFNLYRSDEKQSGACNVRLG